VASYASRILCRLDAVGRTSHEYLKPMGYHHRIGHGVDCRRNNALPTPLVVYRLLFCPATRKQARIAPSEVV
jgi:hypothetical protein